MFVLLLVISSAEVITLHETGVSEASACLRNKTLHIIRHAEGHHNADEVAAEREQVHTLDPVHTQLREEFGIAWMLLERVSGRKYHDPLLTAAGREQAYALRSSMRANGEDAAIDLVVFSPMRRTISTALLGLPQLETCAASFELEPPVAPTAAVPRMVATDLLRERVGPFMCDSRLSRTELEATYARLGGNASIDFSEVSELDEMFAEGAERDEPEVGSKLLAARAAAAIEWLAALPDEARSVAVVGHKHILGAVSSLHPRTVSQRPFRNAERRMMTLCVGEEVEEAEEAVVKPVRARVQPLGRTN